MYLESVSISFLYLPRQQKMKALSVPLGLACAASTVLARDRAIYAAGTPGNNSTTPEHPRNFRRATVDNWSLALLQGDQVTFNAPNGLILHVGFPGFPDFSALRPSAIPLTWEPTNAVSGLGMGGVIHYVIMNVCNTVIRKVRCKRYRCITLCILYIIYAWFRDLKVVNFGPDFHQVKVPNPPLFIVNSINPGPC